MTSFRLSNVQIFIPKRLKRIGLHCLCWLLLISTELCWLFHTGEEFRPLYTYLVYYAINISLFYAILGLGKFQNNGIKLIGFFFIFILFLSLKAVVDYGLGSGALETRLKAVKLYVASNAMRGTYFCLLALFYLVAGFMSDYRKQAAEAKIAYRQQQLQPHLLFNTLNMIYNQVDAYSPSASRCVWLLSELMRYSLDPGAFEGKVRVSDEKVQLENLVKLNKARFGPDMALSVHIGEMGEARIIPLVLLTLTENLFKHGDLLNPAEPAFLTLELIGQRICFKTSNRSRVNDGGVRGIGLENTRIRLDHAYGKNYRLLTSYTAGRYELYLEVPA